MNCASLGQHYNGRLQWQTFIYQSISEYFYYQNLVAANVVALITENNDEKFKIGC